MCDRRVRTAFVLLILAFPALMALANPRRTSWRDAAPGVVLTGSVLALGLLTAARERGRLLQGRGEAPPARRALSGVHHAARVVGRATGGR
jgi:hypothetical protein